MNVINDDIITATLAYLLILAIADLKARAVLKKAFMLLTVVIFYSALTTYSLYYIIKMLIISATLAAVLYKRYYAAADAIITVVAAVVFQNAFFVIFFASLGINFFIYILEQALQREIFKNDYPFAAFLFTAALLYYVP